MQKFSIKTFLFQIQEYTKKIIYHKQISFIPPIQIKFNILKSINASKHINKFKYRNHLIILFDSENTLENSTPLHNKSPAEPRGIGPISLNNKCNIFKPTTNNMLTETCLSFPLMGSAHGGQWLPKKETVILSKLFHRR